MIPGQLTFTQFSKIMEKESQPKQSDTEITHPALSAPEPEDDSPEMPADDPPDMPADTGEPPVQVPVSLEDEENEDSESDDTEKDDDGDKDYYPPGNGSCSNQIKIYLRF